MERAFWLERWAKDQLGWHQADVNPSLQRYWPTFDIDSHGAAFVPLCGKSLDMRWLHDRGHRVYGVELARQALDAFFAEANLPCEFTEDYGGVALLSYEDPNGAPAYRLYCGDFFELSAPHLRGVVGTYDRGALVALPGDLRANYADHLQRIIPDGSHILLLTLEYDQSRVSGPPFSVSPSEVDRLYGERCRIECLNTSPVDAVPPHFRERGVTEAREGVYHLKKID